MTLRALWVAMLLLPLAGCLGFGGDDADADQEDDCPDTGDNMGDTMPEGSGDVDDTPGNDTGINTTLALPALTMQANETGEPTLLNSTADPTDVMDDCPDDTPVVPNTPPVADLTITMEDGSTFGNNSYILPGATLTFSARGSSDSDGTIGLAGLTVMDANGTRSVNLMQNGSLVDAILKFNHPGIVDVTLRVIDDRGDAASTSRKAYVNFQETGSGSAEAFNPQGSGCGGATGGSAPPLIEETFYAKEPFVVTAGAKWISVAVTNTRAVSICDPSGSQLANGATSAETEEGDYPANTQYYLAMHPSNAGATMNYDVIVHFEPKPSA